MKKNNILMIIVGIILFVCGTLAGYYINDLSRNISKNSRYTSTTVEGTYQTIADDQRITISLSNNEINCYIQVIETGKRSHSAGKLVKKTKNVYTMKLENLNYNFLVINDKNIILIDSTTEKVVSVKKVLDNAAYYEDY